MIGVVSVAGPPIENAIRTVRDMRLGLCACYQYELVENPNIAGVVSMRMTIDRVGQVSKVDMIPPTTLNRRLASCLEARALAAQFDPPERGKRTIVAARLTFKRS
jgi:hypothetical protein